MQVPPTRSRRDQEMAGRITQRRWRKWIWREEEVEVGRERAKNWGEFRIGSEYGLGESFPVGSADASRLLANPHPMGFRGPRSAVWRVRPWAAVEPAPAWTPPAWDTAPPVPPRASAASVRAKETGLSPRARFSPIPIYVNVVSRGPRSAPTGPCSSARGRPRRPHGRR